MAIKYGVSAQATVSKGVTIKRDGVEFALCNSLSIKLVKIRQKRSHISATQGKFTSNVIKYRLDDLPRPNHGITFEQLIQITASLNEIIAKEHKRIRA